MKIYECMILLDPDFARDGDNGVGHVRALLEKHGGEVIRVEKYADQKLAYEIRKRRRGVYILAAFRMAAEGLSPLGRDIRFDDNILRELILDRTGTTLDKFFRTYEREESSDDAESYGGREREGAGAR
ncbi:MAG: 30S ribosomal protein S6 [Planctomycetes bacterium]|nr:30S ribosomal protein S6 [Planctomycetota bacterium]